MINKNVKLLKTVTVLATALVFSNTSNAWFWDSANDREMRLTPEGQYVPVRKEGWLERATTYHEELKPTYNPKTQRVERPLATPLFNGDASNTKTSTVKPSWFDRATTYHENDRRPWNPYDVEEKDIPAYVYYDKKEAASYNEHYDQEGLQAIPYMYGSASLVLRRERQVNELDLQDFEDIQKMESSIKAGEENARMLSMDEIYIRPAGGFEGVDRRGAMNDMQMARSNHITMSEPMGREQNVQSYGNVMIGNPKKSDVQAATKIDEPNANWRDKLKVNVDMSRPGDFDYKPKKEKRAEAFSMAASANNGFSNEAMGNGEVIAATGYANQGVANFNNYASEAKVNNYTVEDGDTLSEISDKEKIYGDWTLWPLIYDANRNQVNDPDLINPGQNLDIPRDYNQADEDDARYRSKNREHPISLYDGQ